MDALILAGGRGERLWPASTPKKPKQLLKLISSKTLFEETIERIKELILEKNIFVITNSICAKEFKKLRTGIPNKNFIVEPQGKNTAPAIGLGLFKLNRKNCIAVLTCDHFIKNKKNFQKTLRTAEKFLEKNPDFIVTIGIIPEYPETGYGYIEQGGKIGNKIFKAKRFIEKPNLKKAKEYQKSGKFFWNSGIFIFKANLMLKLFKEYLPEIYSILDDISKRKISLKRGYSKINPISIDYGIMEKYKKIAVIPANLGWSDIGSWESVYQFLPKDENGNAAKGKFIGIDTKGCLIISQKQVAAINLENLVIIEGEREILICSRQQSQRVKEIIKKLKF